MDENLYCDVEVQMCCESCFEKDEDNPIHLNEIDVGTWECPKCHNKVSIDLEWKKEELKNEYRKIE